MKNRTPSQSKTETSSDAEQKYKQDKTEIPTR